MPSCKPRKGSGYGRSRVNEQCDYDWELGQGSSALLVASMEVNFQVTRFLQLTMSMQAAGCKLGLRSRDSNHMDELLEGFLST